MYVKLSIPDIIPYNNFNIQTTAIVNVYTPVFVENENRYGSSVRRKNDSILKFWCFFFYPFDYGNFIRYLINNKTNGYMRNLIFFKCSFRKVRVEQVPGFCMNAQTT